MKRASPLAAILALIFGIPANVALSGVGECRSAVDRYNSVLDDVGTSLRRYANCVSGSRGLMTVAQNFTISEVTRMTSNLL